ncbi:putative phosphatidylinositol-3,4-bisphosphate 4-phosphatase [Trypoxylus dichotomus]
METTKREDRLIAQDAKKEAFATFNQIKDDLHLTISTVIVRRLLRKENLNGKSTEEDNMPLKWIFMQDNDPKHTNKRAKRWFRENKVEIMDWPAQSTDLNPIENLWALIENVVFELKAETATALWEVIEASRFAISSEHCQHLVNTMPRRHRAVIANKGHAMNKVTSTAVSGSLFLSHSENQEK